MPPARTARSRRSWRPSIRRAVRSRASRCRAPRSSRTTTSGASTSRSRARARSASSTGRTTRTSSSSGSTTSCRRPSGRSATTRSTTSSGCWPSPGTTIVKFFLSIDRDEQRERFQARYDDPTRRWKFSMGDLEERKLWDDYQAAFDEALSKTSTDVGALVRHPGEPQVVPQPGGLDDPGRHDRRPQAGLPARARPARRTSSSSSRRWQRLYAAAEQGAEDAADDVLSEARGDDPAAGPDRAVDRLLALSRGGGAPPSPRPCAGARPRAARPSAPPRTRVAGGPSRAAAGPASSCSCRWRSSGRRRRASPHRPTPVVPPRGEP